MLEGDEALGEGIEPVVVAGAVFQQVAVIKDVAAFAGAEIGDDDGISRDGGGAAIGGDASGALEDGAVLLGGEFNGVGASAGGDVDLKATGDTDLVGTVAAIDGNGGKAVTAAAELGCACSIGSDRDLIVSSSAVGGDINPSVGAISGAANGQLVVAFSAIKNSLNRCCGVA